MTDVVEYQYMRPVEGFGWPQGYPEPVEESRAKFRRRKGDTKWEPYTPAPVASESDQ